mmetsp:Transcript_28011/g.89003  ORF Transcript_28011/g.89003 Transcript_28011/m.89003 type:complete len:212 (+) Transcript_28011:1133-1768(+)
MGKRGLHTALAYHGRALPALQEDRARLHCAGGRPVAVRPVAVHDAKELPTTVQAGHGQVVLAQGAVSRAFEPLEVHGPNAAALQQGLCRLPRPRPQPQAPHCKGLLAAAAAEQPAGERAGDVPRAAGAPDCVQRGVRELLAARAARARQLPPQLLVQLMHLCQGARRHHALGAPGRRGLAVLEGLGPQPQRLGLRPGPGAVVGVAAGHPEP